jgi:hypothetical protein
MGSRFLNIRRLLANIRRFAELSGLASVHNGQPPRLISTQRRRTLKTRKVRSDPVLGAAYYWIFSNMKAAKDCDIPSL